MICGHSGPAIVLACWTSTWAWESTSLAAAAARAQSDLVALLAPSWSRVADDLRRELAASLFVLTVVDTASRPWREQAAALGDATRGVAVQSDESRAYVFTIGPAGEVQIRADLPVPADDRVARRRLTFAVVEHLRLLAEETHPRPPPPPPAGVPPTPDARPLPATETSATPPRRTVFRPWGLGAATTINFDSYVGEPTSHVLFVGLWRISPHFDLSVRALWPVVGSRFNTEGVQVRMWTFGVGPGLVLRPLPPSARVQPYFAVGAGARAILADTTLQGGNVTNVSLTPAVQVDAEVGARFAIAPRAHLFFELQASLARHIGAVAQGSPERAAANARSANAALGLLFEF